MKTQPKQCTATATQSSLIYYIFRNLWKQNREIKETLLEHMDLYENEGMCIKLTYINDTLLHTLLCT